MTTLCVDILKPISMRDFVIKRAQTPCVFMVHFEDPPFASALEVARSKGRILTVTFKAYDFAAKHFQVCKVE